jgi:NADPH2:quinone reductase
LYLTRPFLFTYVASRAELLASAAELFAAVQSGTVRINVNQRYP